ncbi:response regulator transcription factor [Actinomycetota bacterium Odt1-20B]
MRIVIAESSTVLRAGLSQVLRGHGHRTLAALAAPGTLPAVVREHRPDAVLTAATDDGVRAALAARRTLPDTAALCYTTAPDPRHAALLFAEGGAGVGYVLLEQVMHSGELLSALDVLTGGGTVVDPRLVGALAQAGAAGDGDTGALGPLSDRERQVLALMAQGRTNGAIAQDLKVSAGTVEKHVAALFGKLGLPGHNRDNRRVLAVLRYLAHIAGQQERMRAPVLASVA